MQALLWGERRERERERERESGWSTHFLSLPFPGMSERSQANKKKQKKSKKSDLLLDRLGLEQCGNYGWQEGRCAVERGGRGGGGIIPCQRL